MRQRGMTLVEVLAGLAILGSLLAAMLVARGRFVSQWSEGRQRIEAVAAADALLTTWWSGRLEDVPRQDSGEVVNSLGFRNLEAKEPDTPSARAEGDLRGREFRGADFRGWSWRTRPVELADDALVGLEAEVIRLEVYRMGHEMEAPVVTVEFVLLPEPEGEAELALGAETIRRMSHGR